MATDAHIPSDALPPDLAPNVLLPLSESETQAEEHDSTATDSEAEILDEKNDKKLYISDLRIDCVSEKATDLSIKLIQLLYNNIDNNGLFSLNEVSSTSWRTDNLIILPFNTSSLDIYVHGEGHYNLGLIQLKKNILTLGKKKDSKLEYQDTILTSGVIRMRMQFTLSTEYHGPQKSTSLDDITLLRQVIQLTPEGHSELPFWVNNLGSSFQTRFDRFGDITDISEAISLRQKTVQLTPKGHPDLPTRLSNLGTLFWTRYEHFGDITDISDAISLMQESVQLTPKGHPSLPAQLSNLGSSFKTRFECFGDITDISKAITLMQEAVQLTPEGHPDLPTQINNLGSSFWTRFEHFGDITDISEAISLKQKAVQLTPKGHPNFPLWLNNLGTSFQARFEHFGDITDISKAISLIQEAVQLTPKGHPDLPARLNNLGSSFQNRFEHFGDSTDISKAISLKQQAIQLTPKGHLDLTTRLSNLGTSFHTRFDRFGDITDISEAISLEQKAIQLTPKGHPSLPAQLTNLGSSFQTRFEHFGDIPDISEAISLKQKAVQLTPKEHPNFPTRLNNLGSSFQTRFERFGDITDISEAITLMQEAMQLIPRGHPDLPTQINNLGTSLHTRFVRFGDIIDISGAISLIQEAVQLTPKGHSNFAARLNNLGSSFQTRFDRFGDVTDISEAISLKQQAVQLTPKGHPDLPAWLSNLGISFQTRFDRFGDITDISEAISLIQEAVQLTPKGHPNFPTRLNNLGSSFQTRFAHLGDITDISEAITLIRDAIQLIPKGHPDLPTQINNLGISFHTRFAHFGDITDISEAISHYRLAAISEFGYPKVHLNAAKKWARLTREHRPSQEIEAQTQVIDLMSKVAGIEQTVELRHTNITSMSALASQAVAVALSHGQTNLALEWLEQGRCLVWNQLNQLRTPSHNLQTKYPELAVRFRQLSAALANAGSRQRLSASSLTMDSKDVLAEKVSLESAANAHIKDAREYDQLLKKIRAIPEFKNFLRPRTASEILAHLPKAGPVILINVHEDRCDGLALVSGHEEPLHIPLVHFTRKRAEDLRLQLSKYLSECKLQTRNADRAVRPFKLVKHIELILRVLWLEVVKPIFDALGFEKPESQLRRIWWCTTGPLASLPIHAAGIYHEGGACVSDFAVSSYIPTVSMLVDRIKDIREDRSNRFLLVSQAHPNPHKVKDGDEERTVTLSKIPGVDEETSVLKKLMEDSDIEVLRLAGNDATISNVQKEMTAYQSIHLACHGTQDFRKPLQSGFYLLDGRLELFEIMKRHDLAADLAFLSACETSTGDETLTDEAVHLAAGMLAVGYRSVVATMWSIKDSYGPEVAEDFYSELLKSGEDGKNVQLDGADAAYALHYAVQRLRKKVGDKDSGLLTWLPYVHFGI